MKRDIMFANLYKLQKRTKLGFEYISGECLCSRPANIFGRILKDGIKYLYLNEFELWGIDEDVEVFLEDGPGKSFPEISKVVFDYNRGKNKER